MARKKNEPSPDAAERKALLDYVKELDPNANFILITSQLKRMTDEGMTYSGIRYALWYSINVKQMPYKGIGIIPYVYEEAKTYWQWQQRMKQQVASWQPQDNDAVVVKRQREDEVFV